MWPQTYAPVAGSLQLSAVVAVLHVFVVLVFIGVCRRLSWVAAVAGFATSAVISVAVYHMPFMLAASSALYGAANGMLPIGWIVFTAILLYRVTVDTGKFEIIKNSLGEITNDRSVQALLIAFAFAASICLLANTSPVAFGSIGTPIVMLERVTKLPMDALSANVGRLCAPISLFLPAYLVLVMGGWPALRAVFPAAIVCGVAFGGA